MEKEKQESILDEIKKRRKHEWIEVMFSIEAMAINSDVVKSALEEHIEKLSSIKDVYVYEKEFTSIERVKNPPRDFQEAYSQIAKVKLFAKDLYILINIVLVYGPSSIEILGPNAKEIKAEEVQNILNILAGLMHQFAAAGVGGIVITPP